jgi:hypothetical protein
MMKLSAQVLIPVTEVQVKASTVKDMSGHYLWELIHLTNNNEKIPCTYMMKLSL